MTSEYGHGPREWDVASWELSVLQLTERCYFSARKFLISFQDFRLEGYCMDDGF